jgi:hypothetical protein
LILLVGLPGGIFVALWDGARATKQTQPQESPLQTARGVVSRLGFGTVEVHSTDEALTAVGLVKDDGAVDALSQGFSDAGVQVDNRVRSLARVKEQIAQTLQDLGGSDLEFSIDDTGVLSVQGFYAGDLTPPRLHDVLEGDIPGLQQVKLSIRTMRQARELLERLLLEAGLSTAVTVSRKDDGLAAGAVPGARITQAAWEAVATKFEADTNGAPPLISEIEFSAAAEPRAAQPAAEARVEASDPPTELHLTGVVMIRDGDSFAVFKNRGELRVGDEVGGGFKLAEIHPEYVVIADGATRHTLELRDYK